MALVFGYFLACNLYEYGVLSVLKVPFRENKCPVVTSVTL